MSVYTKCVAAAALSVIGFNTAAMAAPSAFQTTVLNNAPAVYYRFNESPITAGTATTPMTTAADASGHGFVGNYVGSTNPVSTAGVGAGTDNAVTLDGVSQFVQSTDTAFGTSILNSSYEFVYKAGASLTANQPVLFGVANSSPANGTAVYVVLNSNAGGTTTANSLRFYIRTDSNAGGHYNQFGFTDAALFDGNYHDLLMTYSNGTGGSTAAFTAYDNGVAVFTASATSMTGTPLAFQYDPGIGVNDFKTNAPTGGFANVSFDEAALYASTLTAGDALAHAQAAGLPEPASLGLLAVAAAGLKRRRA